MNKSPKANQKKIAFLAKACLAIGLLIWVGSKQDWQGLKTSLLSINIFVLFIGIFCFTVSQICIALRWQLLLGTQKIHINIKTIIKLHFLGLFYNNFLPSSVGGDFLKAWYVAKHTDKKLEAALSVFVDRAVGLISLTVMFTICYILLKNSGQWNFTENNTENAVEQTCNLYKIAIIGIIALGVMAISAAAMLFHPFGKKYAFKFFNYCKNNVLRVIMAFKIYLSRPLTFIAAILITIFGQTICITGFWLIGENIGVGVSAKYYFVFFPIIWLVGIVPISIGGIGIMEGLLTILFTQVGGYQEASFALSIFQRIILLIGSLPGILVHLLGKHLPGQEFFVDSKDDLD